MSDFSLDDLLARAGHQVGTRRPNSAIIAQLTSGKERKRRVLADGHDGEENPESFDNVQSSNTGYDLTLHVAVAFTRGGIGIGILQQIEIPGTGKVAPCGFGAPIVKLGYHGEDLRQEKVETREQAQIFALSQAVLLARDTIRDRWPCNVELRKVKLRVGLTGEESGYSRHCVAGLVSEYVRRWSPTGECFVQGVAPAGARRVAKQVERLKVELSKGLNGCTGLVCFEDGEERTDVHKAARQKLKGLQASPRWKGRRQRTAPVTSGRKRIHEIVQEYRAQHDTMQ